MENASDALIMAGAVLIFIIALTISMSSFTTMRTKIDEITQTETKIDLVKDDEGYINYQTATGNAARVVGVETVISSLYRVAKENYIVYLKCNDFNGSEIKDEDLISLSDSQKYSYYDESTHQNKEAKINTSDRILKIDINGRNSDVNTLLKEESKGGKNLYNALKGKHFYEYLGVYQENTGADESNRTTYRVITYVEK